MSGVLAIVPARGGSKGIPRKNLAPVAGRPLLAWTLDCARASRGLDRIVVSTDSPEVARAARGLGAEVPFLRPAALAADDTPGIAPILHALRWLEAREGWIPHRVVCLQPTSPLRVAADVEAALALAEREEADSVVSVSPARPHPFWARRILPDGRLEAFLPGAPIPATRQALPEAWSLNGAVSVGRRDFVIEHESLHGGRCFALRMPPERSLDVDTPFDLELADHLLRARSGLPAPRSGGAAGERSDHADHALDLLRVEVDGRR